MAEIYVLKRQVTVVKSCSPLKIQLVIINVILVGSKWRTLALTPYSPVIWSSLAEVIAAAL